MPLKSFIVCRYKLRYLTSSLKQIKVRRPRLITLLRGEAPKYISSSFWYWPRNFPDSLGWPELTMLLCRGKVPITLAA